MIISNRFKIKHQLIPIFNKTCKENYLVHILRCKLVFNLIFGKKQYCFTQETFKIISFQNSIMKRLHKLSIYV